MHRRGRGTIIYRSSTLAWTYFARIDRLRFMHLMQPKNLDEPTAEEVDGYSRCSQRYAITPFHRFFVNLRNTSRYRFRRYDSHLDRLQHAGREPETHFFFQSRTSGQVRLSLCHRYRRRLHHAIHHHDSCSYLSRVVSDIISSSGLGNERHSVRPMLTTWLTGSQISRVRLSDTWQKVC